MSAMIVLGIESSCDDTAAAVVRDGRWIEGQCIASQDATHAPYGGVVPELASRDHVVRILPCIRKAMTDSGRTFDDLDCIAVTNRPGLIGSLLVGLQAAKGLAWACGLPIVGINHLEGHLCAAMLAPPGESDPAGPPPFPFLGLVVSGGHTSLYAVRDFGQYELVGATRDDAAGEALDKAAKLLGLGYPGGAVMDRLAGEGDPARHRFPRALMAPGELDLSFSGLKTSMAQHVQRHGVPVGPALADLCAAYLDAVTDALCEKIRRAAVASGLTQVVLAGGVAASARLREKVATLAETTGLQVYVPHRSLCTDNAAMIAAAGTVRFQRGERDGWGLDARATAPL